MVTCLFFFTSFDLNEFLSDAMILLWKLSDVPTPVNNIFQEEDADNKETWVVSKTLRSVMQVPILSMHACIL